MAKTTEKNAKGQVLKQAVGTPDYLAPESILGTGQDSMVDWVSDFFFFSLYSFSFFFLLLPVLLLSFHYYFITFFFLHIFFYC
jgi:serine/threonine protein kinase